MDQSPSRAFPASPIGLGVCLLLCALGLGALPACAASTLAQATGEGWRVTFQMSGGIAGLDREMELTSAGAATVMDRRRQRQLSRQVAGDELLEIDRLVPLANAMEPGSRTRCNDCLSYRILLQGPLRQVTIQVGDDGLSDQNIARLVGALSRLMNRLLAEP